MRASRVVVLAVAAVLGIAVTAVPAAANLGDPAPIAPLAGIPSEITITGLGQGHGVSGFIGPVGSVSDPGVPYPAVTPPLFTPLDEFYAGTIIATPVGGVLPMEMYCIDIRTPTNVGYGYNLGEWEDAGVTNVGFVARILNDYFPEVAFNPPLGDAADRGAAVQAAIWYFSDNYVLAPGDPLRPTVAAIVEDVRNQPPLVTPPPPTLQITPPTLTVEDGAVAGPYTIVSPEQPTALVNAVGADMFSDPAGTVPIANPGTVPNGQEIWLRSTTPGTSSATLNAAAAAVVPSGNVYLYSGNMTATTAQRLILARSAIVSTTASAGATFQLDTGSLVVTKTIDGEAAGLQGEVVITVTCDLTPLVPDFVIPAGTPAGTQTQTYTGIDTPATCVITETVNGANAAVTVVTVNGSQTVTVPLDTVAGNPVEVPAIGDTYSTVPTTTTTTTTSTTTTTTTTTTAPTTTTTEAPTTTTDPATTTTGGSDAGGGSATATTSGGSGSLPFTGGGAGPLLGLGLILSLIGGGAYVTARLLKARSEPPGI